MSNPFEMNPAQIMQLLNNPSGVADLLIEHHPETGDSPAEIVADVINVMRADTKRLAEYHGVSIEVQLMSPERAAELLAGCIEGDGIDLLLVFNELADQRAKILREAIGEDEYAVFEEQKRAIMHTEPAGN